MYLAEIGLIEATDGNQCWVPCRRARQDDQCRSDRRWRLRPNRHQRKSLRPCSWG